MVRKSIFNLLIGLSIAASTSLYAATLVDMRHQSTSTLQTYLNPVATPANKTNLLQGTQPALMPITKLVPVHTSSDFNQQTHTRYQQTYNGYRVYGAEVIVHMPQGLHSNLLSATAPANVSMNGQVYDDLNQDLINPPSVSPATALSIAHSKAQDFVKGAQVKTTNANDKIETIVYVDPKTNKAHWAYAIHFTIVADKQIIAEPTVIIDANDSTVYQQYNNLENITGMDAMAGGLGGNEKTGRIVYGEDEQHPAFHVTRVTSNNPFNENYGGKCYFINDDVEIKTVDMEPVPKGPNDNPNVTTLHDVGTYTTFACAALDKAHPNLYWDNNVTAINGGYSPANDAMFVAEKVKKMYQDWYGIPILIDKSGESMLMSIRVNADKFPYPNNATWDPVNQILTLGSGDGSLFYPFSSISVMAHELGHGFTFQHSNLKYVGVSGGLNEAFSDFSAQAAEYYITGKNNWHLLSELIKDPSQLPCTDKQDCAIRYMDDPTKDGNSCDNISQCNTGQVHFISGIFNKVFYLMATHEHWNIKMAYNVMVQANQHYWTSTPSVKDIACSMIAATKDYQKKDAKYDTQTVIDALHAVGYPIDGNPNETDYVADIRDCE